MIFFNHLLKCTNPTILQDAMLQALIIWLYLSYIICVVFIHHIIFFYLGFLSRTFTNYRTAGEEGGYFFNSSLPLTPASKTLRHYPGDYCRELISAHSSQPDSNQEPLISERNSLTTKLRAKYAWPKNAWSKNGCG